MSTNQPIGYQLVETNYALIREACLATINAYIKQNRTTDISEDDKEDIISNVFMKIMEKGHQFNPSKGSFKTWVKRMAFTTMIDFLRTVKHPESLFLMGKDGEEYERSEYATEFSPYDEYVAVELEERRASVMNQRSELDRQIQELYMDEYSSKEIAERLGLTVDAVNMRVFKIKKALRQSGIAA